MQLHMQRAHTALGTLARVVLILTMAGAHDPPTLPRLKNNAGGSGRKGCGATWLRPRLVDLPPCQDNLAGGGLSNSAGGLRGFGGLSTRDRGVFGQREAYNRWSWDEEERGEVGGAAPADLAAEKYDALQYMHDFIKPKLCGHLCANTNIWLLPCCGCKGELPHHRARRAQEESRKDFTAIGTLDLKKSYHYSEPSPMRPNELETRPHIGAARAQAPGCQRNSCRSVRRGEGGDRHSQRRS